jgi:hypothetical protein
VYLQRDIEARSRNHCCRRKAVGITYSEFVSVALFIQREKHVRHIKLSSVDNTAERIFLHYYIKGTILGKKVTEHKIFCLYNVFFLNISFKE